MEVFKQDNDGLFSALDLIKKVPDSVFSEFLGDEQKIAVIRGQFRSLYSNRKLGNGTATTAYWDKCDDNNRDILNRAIVYYKARIDWLATDDGKGRNFGHTKSNIISCFGENGVGWINSVCQDAGFSFEKQRIAAIKTEQEKEAEQDAGRAAVERHESGKQKPVKSNPIITETISQEQQPLIPLSALDCMKIIPKRYILDGLIEDETITLFSGREKIGKTYVLMHMALCMAAGKPWLDIETMSDVSGRVLWLNLDMSRTTAQRRIYEITQGISEAWDIIQPELFNQFDMLDGQTFRDAGCTDSVEFFTDNNAVQRLQEFIISQNVKVCFIDNLIQIEGAAQENSSNDIQRVFNRVKTLRDITHCSFIIIHHTTKDGGRGRGSGDIFAETDLNLQLDQCTNPQQLVIKTDGARNSALHEIGMMKKFMQRIGENGEGLTDGNGHPVNIFRLERIETDGLFTEAAVKTPKMKSQATIESNVTRIVLLFHKNGNAGLTKNGILNACNKNPLYSGECKLQGSKPTLDASINQAIADNRIILRNDGFYCLPE